MEKKNRFFLTLVIFSLVGQVAWVMENMYLNVFIYEEFKASAADISLMVAASSVAATLTTLFMGALSDKLGKRKLFICAGYLCWGISIWAFALLRMDILTPLAGSAAAAFSLGVTLVIALDCIMTFFGSTANDAAFNAWLTDSTDETNRGAAEGINAMMPMLASLVVFGGGMVLEPLKGGPYWTVFFGVIGTVVLVLGILGFFLIREPKVDTSANTHFWKNLIYGFRPGVIRANSRLYLTLLAYAIFGISVQIFMPYLILYYEKTLQMDYYVFLFAPAIVLAAAFTFFYGRVYDRRGFRVAVVPALAIMAAGYVVLWLFDATVPVFVGTLLMLCGYLSGMAVFGAMLRDRTPANRAGMFQGQRIIGQVLIPGIVGPWIGSWVLRNAETVQNTDGTTSFLPNAGIFLAALVALAVIAVALLPLFKSLKKEAKV